VYEHLQAIVASWSTDDKPEWFQVIGDRVADLDENVVTPVFVFPWGDAVGVRVSIPISGSFVAGLKPTSEHLLPLYSILLKLFE